MLSKVCYFLLIQLLLVLNVAFAEGITIVIAPEAKIEGSFITLGQIAEISGDDAAWVNSLRLLKIGSAPSLGSSLVLSKELLHMRLAATGSDFSGIVWKTPETVIVTRDSQIISGQALLEKSIAMIEQQTGLRVSSGDLSIMPISGVQDVITPAGTIGVTTALPYGIHYNIPTNVTAIVSVNGQIFTKLVLKMDVKLYKQVAVVTGQVSPGEMLTTEKVGYERKDIGRLGAGYFTDINKVIGLVARRTLIPSIVLTDSMLAKPLLIKRGNMVNIIARTGNIEITVPGLAMQDGSVGQLIKVQNIGSTKLMVAKVLDGSTVQVLTYKNNL
ncbi:MAG: flagella basal body P-ring formation protein FlgA [Firmicutes bacterium]|nr:flagella basal body P-ring formation protein FlgA [Bacillota bacterium]